MASKCLHPWRVGIDRQRSRRERDAVGDPGILAMQPLHPFMARQHRRQRRQSKLNQQQRCKRDRDPGIGKSRPTLACVSLHPQILGVLFVQRGPRKGIALRA